jgi:hypothetical protein
VGYLRVGRVYRLRAADMDQPDLVRRFGGTAHFLRRERDPELALVEGEPGECAFFKRALPLGDECDRLFHFADLPSPGGTVDHVSLEFNAGHPGVPEPHYHIVLWHIPKAQERLVKK